MINKVYHIQQNFDEWAEMYFLEGEHRNYHIALYPQNIMVHPQTKNVKLDDFVWWANDAEYTELFPVSRMNSDPEWKVWFHLTNEKLTDSHATLWIDTALIRAAHIVNNNCEFELQGYEVNNKQLINIWHTSNHWYSVAHNLYEKMFLLEKIS